MATAQGYAEFPVPESSLSVGYFGTYDESIGHPIFENVSNRFNPILPANFDLEGTWRLDSSPAPIPFPPPPRNVKVAPFTIGYLETEHYGVDTMTLTKTGSQVIEPGQGVAPYLLYPTNITFSPLSLNQTSDADYPTGLPGLIAQPMPGSERLLIYYYSGYLTHRIAVGCSDRITNSGGNNTPIYIPQATAFIQDLTYKLDAALVLIFDANGKFLWSDLIFKGAATNTPAYPEFPTNVISQFDNILAFSYAPFPETAPFLGIYQSLSGDAITINGGPTKDGALTDNQVIRVTEFGISCPSTLLNGFPDYPLVKLADFKAQDYTGGNIYYFDGYPPVEFSLVYWRRVTGPASSLPSAPIIGQLKDSVTHFTIDRGTVGLYLQNFYLNPPTNGESAQDYNAYVLSNSTLYATTTVDSQGKFSFPNVPVFNPAGSLSSGLKAVQYAVMSKGAQADVSFDTNNPVVYYQDGCLADVSPKSPPPTNLVQLQSLSALGMKLNLANAIINLSYSQLNYPTEEGGVIGDINKYLANTANVTPAQYEGVQRAIWGERAIQEGALDAKAMFTPMLKALATLINQLLSQMLPNTSGRGAQGKKFLDAIKGGKLDTVKMSDFSFPPGVTDNLESFLVQDGNNFATFGIVDKVIDGFGVAIKAALNVTGMAGGQVSDISSGFVKVLKQMAKVMRSASGNGSKSQLPIGTDLLVSYVVPLFAPSLFDNSSYSFSYCSITYSAARDSRLFMEQWTSNNPDAYSVDFQNAAQVISNMVGTETSAQVALAYIDAITQTAGSSAKVFNLAGEIPGFQLFKEAGIVAEFVENMGTATSFAIPVRQIYSELPNYVSNGVYAAFGNPPGPPQQSSLRKIPSLRHYSEGGLPSGTLTNILDTSYAQLNNNISQIVVGLGSTNMGLVITQMMFASPNLSTSVAAWSQAASWVRQTAGSATNAFLPDDMLTALAAEEGSFSFLANGFDYELIEIVKNISLGVYTGKTDTNFLADAASARSDAQSLLLQIQRQYSTLFSLAAGSDLSGSAPILQLTLSPPISVTTGLQWAATSNEMFVLTCHVANVSSVVLSNVTVSLDIQGGDGVATNLSPAALPSTPLTLAPNDGVSGSGADEATVVWNIQYTGALDTGSAFFVVSAMENSTNPVSFTADTESQVLQTDPDLVDSDGDGIPNDWMTQYFGHPTGLASDNTLANDPAPNGDGNTILQDYQLGRNPVGTNAAPVGIVTLTNVTLSLSTNLVVLSSNNYAASILVSSSGTNTAYWLATIDDPGDVTLTPDSSTLATNGQSLSLSLAPDYNFQNAPTVQTTVRIAPAGLSSGATQLVTLIIQGASAPPSGPLAILQQPIGARIPAGSSYGLSVVAQSSSTIAYQWQFNTASIKGATNSTLTLSNVTTAKSGNYRVVLHDSSTSITSSNAQITVYLATNGITLVTKGPGTIRPGFKGTNLIVGNNYAVTAAPHANCIFSNWIGGAMLPYSVLGTNQKLAFTMQSNLVLQANFATNLFLGAQGSYYGLFAPPGELRAQTNSGSITLKVGSTRTASGSLQLGDATVKFSGAFDLSGAATFHSAHGKTTLITSLQLDFANEAVTGSVSDGTFIAQLSGDKDVFSSAHKATNFSGQYTLTLLGAADPTIGPGGISVGTAKIDAMGNISFSGNLADATSFLESSAVSKDGYWPFYASLYGGNGSLWGWNLVSNHVIASAPALSWLNATNSAKTALYRFGFTNPSVQLAGAPYNSTARPLVGLTNAIIVFSGGDLAEPLTNHLTISLTGTVKVTDLANSKHALVMTISAASGAITGSFANPANTKQIFKFNGAILQGETPAATGYFLGTAHSGTFVLTPQ
jgi:hypothetical protein